MLYTVMRSITKVIQYIHKYRWTLLFQIRMVYYFHDFSPWRHEERDTILTMLTPPQHAAHLVISKVSVGRDPKNPTTSFNSQNPTLASVVQSQLTFFSKSSNSQDHLFWAWSHPHSSPISCLGVYYDKWWLSYPLQASVKLHLMTMHLDS